MKRVWKCDFCSETNVDSEKMKQHELTCHFNLTLKFCYSCKHYSIEGYYGDSYPVCDKKFSTIDGEEKGMCKGWKTKDPRLLRKLKIQNLIK